MKSILFRKYCIIFPPTCDPNVPHYVKFPIWGPEPYRRNQYIFVHIQSPISGMDFQPTQPLCFAISLTTGRGHHFLTSLPPLNWHPVLGVSNCPCHPVCCAVVDLRFKMCCLLVSSRRITPCLVFIAHCGIVTWMRIALHFRILYLQSTCWAGETETLTRRHLSCSLCRTTVAGGGYVRRTGTGRRRVTCR